MNFQIEVIVELILFVEITSTLRAPLILQQHLFIITSLSAQLSIKLSLFSIFLHEAQ